MGFQNNDLKNPQFDRMVWLNSTGTIIFACQNQVDGLYYEAITNKSPLYNDANIHHVVATLSPSTGQLLYVDGILQANNSNVGCLNYNGYWRIASNNFTGYPNTPVSNSLSAYLSDFAVYNIALSPNEIVSNYNTGVGI